MRYSKEGSMEELVIFVVVPVLIGTGSNRWIRLSVTLPRQQTDRGPKGSCLEDWLSV